MRSTRSGPIPRPPAASSPVCDVLDAAQSGISGEAKQKLREAAAAVGDLADEAGDAARGADIDTSAIDRAQDSFGEAVDGVRDFC
ncbi:MAG: hypothetical protein CMJ44_20490 [Pimelobacter sp.]|nr:hypothetical protein [Pimelobacter sp.]